MTPDKMNQIVEANSIINGTEINNVESINHFSFQKFTISLCLSVYQYYQWKFLFHHLILR